MAKTEEDRKVIDVANAAAIFAEAVQSSEQSDVEVDTPHGTATVYVDRWGADIQLPGEMGTAHVRFDGD